MSAEPYTTVEEMDAAILAPHPLWASCQCHECRKRWDRIFATAHALLASRSRPTTPEAGTRDAEEADAYERMKAAWGAVEELFIQSNADRKERRAWVPAVAQFWSAIEVYAATCRAVASRARTAGGTRVVVPELTGCCANCGAMPEITMGPVNDTVCIGVKPTCDCIKRGALYASFHLWPAHGVSATTAGGTPGWEDVLDAFENICPGAVGTERERVEQGFPADVGSVCRIVADVVRELEQQIEELRAIPGPPRAADQETE